MKPFLKCPVVLLLFTCLTGAQAQVHDINPGQSGFTKQIIKNDSAFYFKSQGDDIYYRKCGDPKFQGSPRVLLIIHGIGNHSGPFINVMNYAVHDSILVYAIDLRGHGLSGNKKGDLESNEKILADMDNMVGIIREENPNSKIYLLGTSMGGIYALGYLLSNSINSELSGLILVGPALKLHKSQIFQISNLKLLYLLIFDHSEPGFKIDGKRLEMSSGNLDFIDSRKNDSLAFPGVSMDYLMNLQKMQKINKQKSKLSLITVPVLIQHGGKDKIADLKGAYYLKNNLTNTEVELIVHPQSYHALFWDRDSTQILADMVHWVIKH